MCFGQVCLSRIEDLFFELVRHSAPIPIWIVRFLSHPHDQRVFPLKTLSPCCSTLSASGGDVWNIASPFSRCPLPVVPSFSPPLINDSLCVLIRGEEGYLTSFAPLDLLRVSISLVYWDKKCGHLPPTIGGRRSFSATGSWVTRVLVVSVELSVIRKPRPTANPRGGWCPSCPITDPHTSFDVQRVSTGCIRREGLDARAFKSPFFW